MYLVSLWCSIVSLIVGASREIWKTQRQCGHYILVLKIVERVLTASIIGHA